MIIEPQFDIIPLPSEGKFYKNGCDKVKVYHLCLADEEIMTAPNLYESGSMLDILLERKVVPINENTPYIHPSKMLIGDRLALIIFLRVSMDQYYKIQVKDEHGKIFPYNFDLTQLKVKETNAQPDANMEFDFFLSKAKKRVTFRLMTGEDEKNIFIAKQRSNSMALSNKLLSLEQLVMSVEGEREKQSINSFIRQMNIVDANKLINYMDKITPGFDLKIEVPHPEIQGKTIFQDLEIGFDFFFPNTE